MNYFIYILITWVVMLFIFKLISGEVGGRTAVRAFNVRWLLLFDKPFVYKRASNIIFMSLLCYGFSTNQMLFSQEWLMELVVFVASGVVVDALGQVATYYYIRLRFKKHIALAKTTKQEIEKAIASEEETSIIEDIPSFDTHAIIEEYMQKDEHVAIVSVDGGAFVKKAENLPPITYVVEPNSEIAEETLADKSVKVISYTSENHLPFKDEKLDVVVNVLANYDKFDVYRTLKAGGYFIVDQMGSDNYHEIAGMFLPFRMRGRWDQENCQRTLQDIGFQIVDGFEHMGAIRFESLQAVLSFIKKISPERVTEYEPFLNVYARIAKEINENHFFDLSTHRFVVVARKP